MRQAIIMMVVLNLIIGMVIPVMADVTSIAGAYSAYYDAVNKYTKSLKYIRDNFSDNSFMLVTKVSMAELEFGSDCRNIMFDMKYLQYNSSEDNKRWHKLYKHLGKIVAITDNFILSDIDKLNALTDLVKNSPRY